MMAGDERSIAQFAQVLRSRKKVSEGTVSVYLRDLQNFDEYLRGRNRTLGDVLASDIEQYLRALSESGKSSAVQARVATSLRQFYGYLASFQNGENPMSGVRAPSVERKKPEILSRSEVRAIFEATKDGGMMGRRDLAILQSMYYAQLKLNEVLKLRIGDLNLGMGYLRIAESKEQGKVRVVMMNRELKETMEHYLYQIRPGLVREATDSLFLNYAGKVLTRQGFWKNFKQRLVKLELDREVNFALVRNSFEYHNFGIDRLEGHV